MAHGGGLGLAVTAALVLVCLALRQSVGIDRGCFFWAWLAGRPVAVRWPADRQRPGELAALAARWRIGPAIGLADVWRASLCSAASSSANVSRAMAPRSSSSPAASGNTSSLLGNRRHPEFGNVVVYPAMIDSYWTLATQLLLGPGELSTRLVYWMWWLGIFLLALSDG